MGAQERATAARARMDQVRRETAERRALRHRNIQEARAKAMANLRGLGPALEQNIKQAEEVTRRREQAGGWATQKIDSDKNFVMAFDLDGEGAPKPAYPPPPPPVAPEPNRFGVVEDEVATPAPVVAAEEPPPSPARPPVRETRPVRQHEVLDDEDDFSNQSSWMRNE
jgi:hypothetical protein